jgi:hypothetical protein
MAWCLIKRRENFAFLTALTEWKANDVNSWHLFGVLEGFIP